MEFIVQPLLWWLALPVVLLALYAIFQTRRAPDAAVFSSIAPVRQALAGHPSTAMRRHVPALLAALALAISAVALARPALRTPLPRERATIVLVIDVSGSMAASDIFPSRLGAAKRASRRFVDTLPDTFRVGVVSFSSGATLVQPVTDDHGAVHAAIEGLEIGGGTAIGDGIQVALAALPSELLTLPGALLPGQPAVPENAPAGGIVPGAPPPPPPAVVLLLTDGQNTEGLPPMTAAQAARAANIPVFTVGMGGRGGPFTRSRGEVDEDLLREVAALTGGQYYFAPSGGELTRIYHDLGLALGWDWERNEIGGYFATGALVLSTVGLALAFLWLHRDLA